MSALNTELPIFVTGATGYIAKHIVLRLLNKGYHVRGSARSVDRTQEMHDALKPHLTDPTALERMQIVALDLNKDDGWADALAGCGALLHTASPFPLNQPKDPEETVRPAVDGTLRALEAAKATGIRRVILTSSTVAVTYWGDDATERVSNEADWTDEKLPDLTPYVISKTLAEKAAWAFADTNEIQLTSVNPGFVVGAPLDTNFGTSIRVIERVLAAKDPMLPEVGFSTVDVGDIAEIHVRALETDATIGERILGVSPHYLWFKDIALAIKGAFPGRRVPTGIAPPFLLKVLSLFDPAIRTILPDLGKKRAASGDRAKALLGISYRDPRESVVETAQYLIDAGLVKRR